MMKQLNGSPGTRRVYLYIRTLFLLLLVHNSDASSSSHRRSVCHSPQHWQDHPVLCHWLDQWDYDPDAALNALQAFAHQAGWIVDLRTKVETEPSARPPLHPLQQHQPQHQKLPVVVAHGMGDSCFNDGMQHFVALIQSWRNNTYAVCIPTGSTAAQDTKNGYFLSMQNNLELFAAGIRADPQLQNGFHAVGLSQGNNLIRGYIAQYNQPPVHTFVSINGVNAGIGAVPYCRPSSSAGAVLLPLDTMSKKEQQPQKQQRQEQELSLSMCDLLMEQASHRAYTEFAQQHSFQANYWRDPRPSMRALYQKYSQLAVWGNEVPMEQRNATFHENWSRTQQFVWILATDDDMVWPREGEHWGAPNSQATDPFQSPVLPMNETDWYVHDLFGLQAADRAGKNKFESFVGDHLQFSREDLQQWVTAYLIE